MINIKGNLFDFIGKSTKSKSTDDIHSIDIIMHGCNAQGKMGSGFAKELRDKHPEAYAIYKSEYDNFGLLLGTNIICNKLTEKLIICNSITQEYFGYDGKKYVSYDAVDSCTKDLNELIKQIKVQLNIEVLLHMPKIGSGLAGGNWNIISSIIDSNITETEPRIYIL